MFLDEVEHFIEKINAKELPKQINYCRSKIGKEVPPIISPIPQRIIDKNPSLQALTHGNFNEIWSGD